MQILSKSFRTIWAARNISFSRRINCYWFFMRYILFFAVTLGVGAVQAVAGGVMWVGGRADGYLGRHHSTLPPAGPQLRRPQPSGMVACWGKG